MGWFIIYCKSIKYRVKYKNNLNDRDYNEKFDFKFLF